MESNWILNNAYYQGDYKLYYPDQCAKQEQLFQQQNFKEGDEGKYYFCNLNKIRFA